MTTKIKEKVRMVFEYEPETGVFEINFMSNGVDEIIYPYLKYYLKCALEQFESGEIEIQGPTNVVKYLQ